MFGLRECSGAHKTFALIVPQTTLPCKLILVGVHLMRLYHILCEHELLRWTVGTVADCCCHAGRPEISARKVIGADCYHLWRVVHCSNASSEHASRLELSRSGGRLNLQCSYLRFPQAQ